MDFLKKLEDFLTKIIQPLERFTHKYVLFITRFFLERLDPLGKRIEGTLFKKILQVSIYPIFMVATFYIGFELVENGFTKQTFAGTVLMYLIFGLIFAPLERIMPFSRKWLGDGDVPTDWFMFFGGKLWGDYINPPIKAFFTVWILQQIPNGLGKEIWPAQLNPVVQVLLLICITDFFRYWYHRWMHENEFMWRWHSVHHSSERLYWFNGSRSHSIEYLIQGIVWVVPYALIQAPVEIVFVSNLVGRTIGRFQHTNLDVILGPFDYIFSSPKNHRYHHSKSHVIGHSNYGGDVIIWDLLFGTFYMPKGQQPSDEIGIEELPNYPKSFIGLMLAPFTYGRLKKEAAEMAKNQVS